jgi:hypothetical protein
MNCVTTINYESVSLGLSIASVAVSVAAVCIAKSSLSQAKRFADRDQRSWRQRKWFDLYLKANEAYDSLDRFQGLYVGTASFSATARTPEFEKDWNQLIGPFREVHAMAVVFPKNSVTHELFLSTGFSNDPKEAVLLALSKDHLEKVFNAVEGIRQRALITEASVHG